MAVSVCRWATIIAALVVLPTQSAGQGSDTSSVALRNDSVQVRLVDADLRAAVQALARYVDRPVVFGAISGARVTLETPSPVPRDRVIGLLRGMLQSQNLELAADSGLYRVQPREQRPAAAPDAASSRPAQGTMELFTIRLKHARAADVAATVNALYGRSSALGEIGGRPPTLDEQLRQNQAPPAGAPPPQAAPGVAGRAATLTGDVTIVPDPRSNSLLVRASRSDFELIEAAVEELDIRPLQVLIEVLIAEIRRDRSFSLGVDAESPPGRVRGTDTKVSGSLVGAGVGDLVLRIMDLSGINIDAALAVAAERGDVKIMSRPVVIAANNEQAVINVGSQRPFVQVSRSLPTDAATRDQVVQYKDVGTRLTVQPTISPDGYVVLQVTQEVNSATAEVAFDAPVISTRSVQTQLLIKDGQTVALGGLTDRQRESNKGGVPLLSSLPLVGGLFGHASRRTTETELFLFLTPRVIRTDEDATKLTEPLEKRAREATP